MCSYLAVYPDRATTAINTINGLLQRTNETAMFFANTLTYINNPMNQMKLTNGSSECSTFFISVKDTLVADFETGTQSFRDAQTAANEQFTALYSMIMAAIG